jgi:hypothetical protein
VDKKMFEHELRHQLSMKTTDTDELDFRFLVSLSENLDDEEREWLIDLIIRLIGAYL